MEQARPRAALEGKRLEDERLITGRGQFLADLVAPQTLHCTFARSPIAHGLLRGIDRQAAQDQPEVVAVYTAADLNLRPIPGPSGRGVEAAAMKRPPLATDRVRYVGEPLAAVVALTETAAIDGAEVIVPDLETLPIVADPREALSATTLLFSETATNVVSHQTISTSTLPDRDYEVMATVEVDSPRLSPVTLEPAGLLAIPEDGKLQVWCGHQAPHRLRDQLVALLGLEPGDVRVRVPEVGGAFGLKGMLFPEYVVVAAAALGLGRPIVWLQQRREQLIGGTHGRGQQHRIELAGDADGRIRRARIEILADTGAYPHNGAQVPFFTQYLATGLYDIEDVSIATTVVTTNRAPTGSYRGAGRPEAALAIERAVDAFAAAGGLDPAEVRRRNFIRALPHRTVTGALYDSGNYAEALEVALDLVGEKTVRADQEQRRAVGADPLGLGIAAFVERAGGAVDSGEWGRVAVNEDGSVTVATGSVPAGQGHETVWRRLVALALAVDAGRVNYIAGDTSLVAFGTGTFASRSAQMGASAAWQAAVAVREQGRQIAADLLEAAPADLILADGAFSVAGVPGSSLGWAEIALAATARGTPLESEEMFMPNAQTFPYGVHVAVVEVELETGEVHLRRLVAVDDCGEVLDPVIVEGQLHGSLMQGLGQALLEEIRYDENAQPLATTLVDYLIPSSVSAFPLATFRMVSPAPSNPLGVKGTGEAGCIGAPAAVLNAVHDALAPWGIDNLNLPLTPVKVWSALQTNPPPMPSRQTS